MSNGLFIKLAIFLVATCLLIYVSRASLLLPRSHGFYRFLAWECMLVLFLLVVDRWFRDPFSPVQLVSWLLMSISAGLVLHGIYLLRRIGRPVKHRPSDESLMAFEKTTELVKEGAYHYIRHPLYSSLLFLAWGMFFKSPFVGSAIAAITATGFLVATARADEAECVRYFGPPYEAYMKQTKMFIPFLF
jgi:protein-S-isoprenylcysteine O-methyltransferase Ste14